MTIGNEILKGKTVNTNAAEIGRILYFSGYEVYTGVVVPDVREEIGRAFRSLLNICDVIVSSGGLGPTFDDITVDSFSQEFGIPLVRDEEVYGEIKKRAERRGSQMTKEREKMSLVPKGAKIIKNEVGSAPGMEYEIGATRIFILPGVPREMKPMMEQIGRKIKREDNFYSERSIEFKGIYEATIAPHVNKIMKEYNGAVYIKSHPSMSEGGESVIEVEVSARSGEQGKADKLVDAVLKEISETLKKLES